MTRVDRQWMRGAGPLAVLTLLSHKEMYGYQLAEALDRRSEGVLAMGHSTLYPLLYNLEAKGLIEARTPEVKGGRPRRYYHVTAQGQAWLERNQREWVGLVEAMDKLGVT